MKKALITTILVGILGVSTAMAAGGWGHGGFGKGADRLKEFLNLSDSQSTQIETIMQEEQTKMKALRDETHQRIVSLLSPEQAQKFDEMRAKRQQRMEKRREHMQERRQRHQQRMQQNNSTTGQGDDATSL